MKYFRKIKANDFINNNSDSSSTDSEEKTRKTKTKTSSEDLSVQTGGELLKHYNAVSVGTYC